MEETFNYEEIEKEAIKALYEGKPLTGKDGALAPLLKRFLEKAMEGEMEVHLGDTREEENNRRNGKMKKEVRSAQGKFEVETPRDRNGTYEPKVLPKRQTIITPQLEERIISMWGRGMSYREIQGHIEELYGFELSEGELTLITDKVYPMFEEWQRRPLESIYVVVWLDAMYYKVRVEGRVVQRVMYSVLGLNLRGYKEVLGLYLSESEGAKFWLTVLSDLKQRGVEDVLISAIDNLSGFAEAIEGIFPRSRVQLCVVHQIRGSLRFVPHKHYREFIADMKAVYQAPDLAQAEEALLKFTDKWKGQYPKAVQPWMDNWVRLSTYFDYPAELRRIMYTTNTIEGYHRQIRKITKTKGAFPSDKALLKLSFLAIRNMNIWNKRIYEWKLIFSQVAVIFDDRLPKNAVEQYGPD